MEKRVKGVGPGRLGGVDSERMRKENFERLSERRLNDAKDAILASLVCLTHTTTDIQSVKCCRSSMNSDVP